MDTNLIVATAQGVVICEKSGGEWRPTRGGLDDNSITCLSAQGEVILAGTRQGIFRSIDGGNIWSSASRGLQHPHLRWLACDPQNPGAFLAGSEPAGICLSRDGGESWQGRPEVERLRDQHRWYLPYSPEAGCVRGFATHSNRVYAAVEVGGVLISNDGGESWAFAAGSPGGSSRLYERQVHADVHSIEVHPASPDLVYAPTGGGFYRSLDGGGSWDLLYRCYCRAVWVDPADPDHLILGPADGVDREGRIEETRDGGRTWQEASPGLATPWARHMVERFHQAGEELFAVLSNGELLVSPLTGLSWRRILAELPRIMAVVAIQMYSI